MTDFKKGDFLVSKTKTNGLTIGKHYEIVRIYSEIQGGVKYVGIIDNDGYNYNYNTKNTTHNYYYNKFFYSKSELRDLKLKELGI